MENHSQIIGEISTKKLHHSDLRLDGIASECAICGQPLTDSLSIERSIGPSCIKKGYLEEHIEAISMMDAIISLSPYDGLIKFLTENYENGSNRGLMNGLVKVCSLNRSNKELVKDCCNVIEMLGWVKLSNAIRNSCVVITIKTSKVHTGFLEVYLKRSHFKWEWVNSMRTIPGRRFISFPRKCDIIPIDQKDALWEVIKKNFAGECVKTPEGVTSVK